MILVPSQGVESWRELLADPVKHWRMGYSAHTLAHRWEAAGGFPADVSALLATAPALTGIEPLVAIPEHKVPLRGGARPSQTDLWVLARTADDLVSIAVEGKVRESFGPTLGEWMAEESAGKTARWSHLCECLGLAPDCDRTLRYQLVHRTATALIEAKRLHARKAALVVHSFSAHQDGFCDSLAFASQLGATNPGARAARRGRPALWRHALRRMGAGVAGAVSPFRIRQLREAVLRRCG